MMLSRVELGKRLTPNRIRARRAFFTLRNMIRIQYKGIDGTPLALRVNPLSFMTGAHFGQSTAENSSGLKREIIEEFAKMGAHEDMNFRYGEIVLEKGGAVEKTNVLKIELMSNIVSNLAAVTMT